MGESRIDDHLKIWMFAAAMSLALFIAGALAVYYGGISRLDKDINTVQSNVVKVDNKLTVSDVKYDNLKIQVTINSDLISDIVKDNKSINVELRDISNKLDELILKAGK